MKLTNYPDIKKFKKGYAVPHNNIKIINSSWGSPKLEKNGKVQGVQFFLVKKLHKMGKGLFGKIEYEEDFSEVWIAEIVPNLMQKFLDIDQFSFQSAYNWNVKAKFKTSEIKRIATIKDIDKKKDPSSGQKMFGLAAAILTGPIGLGYMAGLYLFKDKEKVMQLGIEFKNGKWVTVFFDKTEKKDKKNLDLVMNLQNSQAPF
ncbi:hypothetical protein N9379_00755 [Candidatus Pelagibacter ubique]|jgi:hypothetical protein|nr:hypothetical protein [Candidatus Pelagibacter ubique]|tara:strand:+ start:301 stop:906 length:606 start_codon:yes stop_codon:yes gene_type:complete